LGAAGLAEVVAVLTALQAVPGRLPGVERPDE